MFSSIQAGECPAARDPSPGTAMPAALLAPARVKRPVPTIPQSLERRERGISLRLAHSPLRSAAVPLQRDRSWGCTRANESDPPASDSSRDSASVEQYTALHSTVTVSRVAPRGNPRNASVRRSCEIGQSPRKILASSGLSPPLAVRPRNFGAIRHKPFAVALNKCRKFVSHGGHYTPRPR